MAKIKIITGYETLSGSYLSKVDVYWLPISGDKPENIIHIDDMVDAGYVKCEKGEIHQKNGHGKWVSNTYDIPDGSFLMISTSLKHITKNNIHVQDMVLYTRSDANEIAIDVDFIKEDTAIFNEIDTFEKLYFIQGTADVITDLNVLKELHVILPDNAAIKTDFIPLYKTFTLKEGKMLRRMNTRPKVFVNVGLSLSTRNDDFNITIETPQRLFDL